MNHTSRSKLHEFVTCDIVRGVKFRHLPTRNMFLPKGQISHIFRSSITREIPLVVAETPGPEIIYDSACIMLINVASVKFLIRNHFLFLQVRNFHTNYPFPIWLVPLPMIFLGRINKYTVEAHNFLFLWSFLVGGQSRTWIVVVNWRKSHTYPLSRQLHTKWTLDIHGVEETPTHRRPHAL